MVFHDQVDWRSLEDSLALDVRLIESVFYNLSIAYTNDNVTLDEKRFAKVDVLVALEKTAGYLEKRPWLRVLHTRLACVSFEKEGASLHDFVRSRQRDRTVSLRDVRRRLEAIYADAKLSTEVEERHKNFVAQARAVSPWCVRNPKWLHSSPARQLYGVHILPPRRVTEKELQAQRECVASHARAVVSAAVGVVMDKMLAPYLTRPKTTERRTGRRLAVDSARASPVLRHKKSKREQAERDDQLRALRLELLAPTADLVNTEAEATKKKSKDEIARVMMQLATVEAQGDARLARKVLDHSIVQSGLRRAAEQANRLGITRQPWEVLKLWRELYRASTLQALDTALHA
ncbi:hypothetical protein PInf_015039 [Phytophthora infestans]|nr:hypothetical protein PInf_015039 [Phytophthora infestans]